MGNSHGANAATGDRLARAATASQRDAVATAYEALERAQEVARRSLQASHLAGAARMRAQQTHDNVGQPTYDAAEQRRQYDERVRAVTRAGRTRAPEEYARYQEARAATAHARQAADALLQRAPSQADYDRLRALGPQQRTPEEQAQFREWSRLSRQITRSYTTIGEATLREGEALDALSQAVRGGRGINEGARPEETQAKLDSANTRFFASQDRAAVALRNVDVAMSQLDRALGGDGIAPRGSDFPIRAAAYALFGRVVTEADFARMVGATPAYVQVYARKGRFSPTTDPVISIRYQDTARARSADLLIVRRPTNPRAPSYTRAQTRLIASIGTVRNDAAHSATSGRDILRSVEAMRQSGIQLIEATAARGPHYNGYYSWARMGFTGDIPITVQRAAEQRFGSGVTRVEQIMREPGGPAWWKQHGDTFRAELDFSNPYSANHFERMLRAASRGGQP